MSKHKGFAPRFQFVFVRLMQMLVYYTYIVFLLILCFVAFGGTSLLYDVCLRESQKWPMVVKQNLILGAIY